MLPYKSINKREQVLTTVEVLLIVYNGNNHKINLMYFNNEAKKNEKDRIKERDSIQIPQALK
jgi:hypothetical protein